MRAMCGAFALGVVALQQQAALPGAAAWAGGGLAFGLCVWLAAALRGDARARMRRAGFCACYCAAALAGFGYAAARAQWRLSDALPEPWEGRDIVVTGAVRGLPSRDANGVRFLFDVDGNDAGVARFPATLSLAWYAFGRTALPPELVPGDRWRLRVRLKRPHGNANFGVRDAEAAWLARGIRALGYVSAPRDARRLASGAPGIAAAIDRLRARLRGRIVDVLGDAAHRGIVVALAIGAQGDIGDDDWRVLRDTGTSHLVAISGLHVGMVGGLCAWLAGGFWRRSGCVGRNWPLVLPAQKVAAIGAIAGSAGYAALAGFNVPAQRAWWMLAAAGVAYLSGRSLAPSSVLAAALGCVLLVDPWAVTAPGFWLSFGAVAAILFVSSGRSAARDAREANDGRGARVAIDGGDGVPPSRAARLRTACARAMTRLARRVRDAARAQYAVTIALAPLTVLWFAQIPLAGPLANAFAIPWVGSLVTPTVLAGVVLPAPLDAIAFAFAHALVATLMRLLEATAGAGRTVWMLPMPGGLALATAAAGVVWALTPRGWPLRHAAPLAWLPLLAPASHAPPEGAFRLTALDVGQGSAVLIETARHALLFDAGPGPEASNAGERVVVPFLRAQGVRALDALVVSHADSDHAGGAPAVLESVAVAQMTGGLPPSNRLWRAARTAGVTDALPCAAGQRWRWDGVEFATLWPDGGPRAGGATNAQSCVLRVSAGARAALLTGDVDARSERTLVAGSRGALAAQVLVVPHHGSRTSSTEPFLDSVEPRIAVFQVGYANRFQHPHPTVWARYVGRGIELPRTDRDGAVRIDVASNGAAPVPIRYRDAHRRYWMGR
ncbi:DNA internalization-related competence protein ComEC/Rec2 [Burkholderia oklahomensis]|uniref:DNA internalization-related competence protein ComEC/Rec2 n=3 Tax=Burkholderia oklahomensis TaxID=342113 RepID=A0AAI8B9B3_9BURK|nr:DNA internalization-related competence protein ComEC/Rec2 [Burkholderia oklahomensis]AIO67859.1 DNA internalization-related competence protein ComEC/Rec2 [Burkholderia oklahomensis]AOI44129.1 competence protein ComEC [Burkholderia oklahomensis EO147]KUY49713.1 competence protein ComEC [Burkholderia oklahomensis EO147]QPS36656.1 DNA internalization-related competence protein ComEC/Rec2 [Burkholderia oklahomensis]